MMKILLLVLFLVSMPLIAAEPKPSGPLKAFRGPEGETIVMVEVNDSKEMLVHFQSLGGELEGKSILYKIDDKGSSGKDVFFEKKKGSKTVRFVVLAQRSESWGFYNPTKNQEFLIGYSKKDSEKLKLEDILKAYKP